MRNIYLLLLVTIVLTACRFDITMTQEQEKIKISAILDLSGHYSQFGTLMKVKNGSFEVVPE